jgi:glucuronokinase
MMIRKQAYPRAGLAGNPSDGYFGKTISFVFANFHAQVVLYESPELKILPHSRDHSEFSCLDNLVKDVSLYGYYGGIRLLKATIKRFCDYCRRHDRPLHDRNFTIRYHSNIPHQVGLAGSSAIIVACMRALMEYYEVAIPRSDLAGLSLSVERDELGISAGLQDRVAQVYQGLVYMDFNRETMERDGRGVYEEMDPALLPGLYIAYRADLSEQSDVVHNDLRARFERGDADVLAAMRFWADLTEQAREALLERNPARLARLMNDNFDRRAALCRIAAGNMKMVETARSLGAGAKFTGSGGAIVGVCESPAMFEALRKAFLPMGVETFVPVPVPPHKENQP